MSNPVRIYVLHHPESKLAEGLTNRIYDWFRLPSLEGIPVYVRSAAELGQDGPALPVRKAGDQSLEYVVPLLDAHAVRDPVWHEYLKDIAKLCAGSAKEKSPEWGWKMFPVALDGTAFNMPEVVTQMNFIRYGTRPAPKVTVPGKPTDAEQAELTSYHDSETEEMLKYLTEALARDLNSRLFPQQVAGRFKIFISYARADGTDVPKALRNYIQSQTQSLVFFDENDISFGQAFEESLSTNVSDHARAMIVVNGDHYAERPWCRWEIERFIRPRPVTLKREDDGKTKGPSIQVFQPMLVVNAMAGPKMTLMVPELAQAPAVRWAEGREKACFCALMREVIFGLRDVMVARTMKPEELKSGLIVNRLPGPVALTRLLAGVGFTKGSQKVTVHYPGHGLPLAELGLMERTFPGVRFKAFRDIDQNLPAEMERAFAEMERGKDAPLRGKVIALSTAYNRDDLAALGYLSQHQDEALIHMLRPLLRLGADLMYNGTPPKRELGHRENALPTANRNITLTLLQLLSDERQVVDVGSAGSSSGSDSAQGSLLFNVSAWPSCLRITPGDEASWINACRIRRVMPAEAGLGHWAGEVPRVNDPPPPKFRKFRALTYSHVRKMFASGFKCPVPGHLERNVIPAAFVLIGGAVEEFKGVMPGVMEEFLRAAQVRPPMPIYLVGGLGGATRVLSRALLDSPSALRPSPLKQKHYMGKPARNGAEYDALLSELSKKEAQIVTRQFEELWDIIKSWRGKGRLGDLFSNGLSDQENRELLETSNTIKIVNLIWRGMSRVLLPDAKAAATKSPSAKKPAAARRARGK